MKEERFPGRTYFKNSGKTNWGIFLPWLVIPLAVAALLALAMFGLFYVGHYYVVIIPAIAAVAVAACLKLAVGRGHCRSRWTAGIMGTACATVLYLGYYYCAFAYQLGPDYAGRVDLLPKYIRFRMETDVLRDTHDSSRDESSQRRKGNAYVNWAVFGIEVALVFGICSASAIGRAKKPYCETCKRWMQRELTHFDPAQSTELIEAFRNGSVRSLAALCAKPVFATIPSTIMAVEICPSVKDGMTRDCAVYASLKNVSKAVSGNQLLDTFDASQGKLLMRTLQLNPDEIAALGSRFKTLESISGRAAVTSLMPAETEEEKTAEQAGPFAKIEPVETDCAGRVLTKRNAIIGSAYTIAAIPMLFAGIGLAAWGGMTAFPDNKSSQEVSPETKAVGVTALSIGGVLFLGTAMFFFVNPTYFGNRFLHKTVKREFARRSSHLIAPDDPDALFVEIVPKLNWGKMAWENASDVGFIKVDKPRHEILFEGDKERWRIPAAAITHCELEFFVEGQGSHAARKIFYTVMRARHPTQFWEAPIRERGNTGLFRSGRRKKSALRLCEAIKAIQPGA